MTTVLDFSKPHVLRNDAEYGAAIAEIERPLDEDVGIGSEGYERLECLSVLVEHYEDERYPMGDVTPQQAVMFMLEQKGLSRSDLDDVMGGKSRVSEFLSGRRELSKSQVEGLRRLLGIPADVLLGIEGRSRRRSRRTGARARDPPSCSAAHSRRRIGTRSSSPARPRTASCTTVWTFSCGVKPPPRSRSRSAGSTRGPSTMAARRGS